MDSQHAQFLWGWNDYPPQPDPLMTRDRAARLLRSWRRLLRQPANHRPLRALTVVRPGTYRVESAYGEVATMVVPRRTGH